MLRKVERFGQTRKTLRPLTARGERYWTRIAACTDFSLLITQRLAAGLPTPAGQAPSSRSRQPAALAP